jgi:hypothetical protein|tara:strand:- start:414 stop:941 length:528 start_codon:yes stop_codon:yes gene_type:complete
MTTKINPFTTETVDVAWAHLHKPDDKFGADTANHNITIVVDKELQKRLDSIVKETGAKKINGMRTDDEGRTLLKAKSKTLVKKGVDVFPCRDAAAQRTEAVPFGGDKVRLRLAPAMLTRDDSISLYLNGVQIIEKNDRSTMATGGFEATDGFDGSDYKAPESSSEEDEQDDDLPF